MTRRILLNVALTLVVLGIAVAGGVLVYRQWQARQTVSAAKAGKKPAAPIADGTMPARLSPQARANLGIVSRPLAVSTYWRKIEVPGVIADWPGVSDRAVAAPIAGVVTEIHGFPGDTVEPQSPLFTIRLQSESLNTSQLELFKATREIELVRQKRDRLEPLVQSGGLPKPRLIELDNDILRLQVNVQAYRQDLQGRGLTAEQIGAAATGEFLSDIVVRAPAEQKQPSPAADVVLAATQSDEPEKLPFSFEVEQLKVELGQQILAGEVLCILADHRALLIEGRGFKEDMPRVQEAVRNAWPVEVDFELPPGGNWPAPPATLHIQHVANLIDEESRTFRFFLPLENQWQPYAQQGQTHVMWRFRPGGRVQLHVPVEKLENVLVLPKTAVVWEGPEAYIFRQNGDLFDRRPVHVLAEDRTSVVIANDGSLRPGSYIAQNAAASLNRVLKAQLASGQPTNLHVHADGTTHAAH
jgi:biotin carboxyl carrier protein